MKERGFSLVEIMVAAFVTVLMLASVYTVYLTGVAYFASGCKEVYIQSKARLSADRLVIGSQVEDAAPGIADGLRFGRSVEIFDDLNDSSPNPLPASGDYIKVYFPMASAMDPQGYYFSGSAIMATMGTIPTDDDTVVVDNVVKLPGTDVFSQDATTGLISINFSVEDTLTTDGYQGIDIRTSFYQRN